MFREGRGLRRTPGGRGAGRPLRAIRPAGILARQTVALLPGEPAGFVATRTAGAVELCATLTWRARRDAALLPPLRARIGGARCSIASSPGPEARTLQLAGEIRALSEPELAAALEAVLRDITATAAVTEAALEVRAVRAAPPRVASPRALQELALDLRDAGLAVSFGASWTPAPEADAYAGAGDGLEEFLLSHTSWSVT